MNTPEKIPSFGIISLDENGKVCFTLGGFPGSKAAVEQGVVLPISSEIK